MDLDNARPGAPDYRIDDDNFRNRFDTEPWMLTYKTRQRDGAFWDRASVRDRYDDIRVPAFLIGGWYDGYRDSVPRMLEHVKNAPVKAIIGAWDHAWPNEPYPNPGMEWRHEAVRWFDHWLKGVDTGHHGGAAPRRVRARLASARPASRSRAGRTGATRTAGRSRATRIACCIRSPNHTLAAEAARSPRRIELRYIPSVGFEAGGPVMWWGDVAHDQRGTDAFSLVYDSEPLTERPRDPGAAACDADGRGECDARQLVRARLRRRARRHGDAGGGRRP